VKLQRAITLLRDIVLMGIGAFIAINEERTGVIHPELLILAATLLGVPAASVLLLGSRGRSTTPDTTESSSSSPPASPSQRL
jgi:hypothetical protein